MQEKRRLLTSREIGRDEDSTQSLQKKLDALQIEIEAFKTNMERLNKMAQSLVARQHYDASNVEIKQVIMSCVTNLFMRRINYFLNSLSKINFYFRNKYSYSLRKFSSY